MSIYDEITSAKDLVLEVKAHGLSTKLEDICRAQDIFGNSTVEELESLATDNGRYDRHGNPDPFGSCVSGKGGTQETFYQIIFTIWSWQEAAKYYNEHSNPLYIEGRKAVKRCDVLTGENQRLLDNLDTQIKAREEVDIKLRETLKELHVSCIRSYDLQAIRYFLTEQIEAEQEQISRATEDIVANIEQQDSHEYINACDTIKEAKVKLSQYKKLLSNLAEIKGVEVN